MDQKHNEISVCHDCIGDDVVKKRIHDNDEFGECSFCKKNLRIVPISIVSEWVDEIYSRHYRVGSDILDFSLGEDYGIEYQQFGSYPQEIISEILQSSEDISSNIASYLHSLEAYSCAADGGTPMYQEDCCYEKIPQAIDAEVNWYSYSRSLKHGNRFINAKATSILKSVFLPLLQKDDENIIRNIKPGDTDSVIYRARIGFNRQERKRIIDDPQIELGIPPLFQAKSGRMHSAGIPAFYGSYDRDTCIYEIRPPIGALAISGEFRIKEEITVIDLTKLNSMQHNVSIFDEAYDENENRKIFIEQMVTELSRPILPQHSELEYIPTQFLAEYISTKLGKRIQGIIFSSSQNPNSGINIILLGRIAEKYIAELSLLSLEIYEDFEFGYSIGENATQSQHRQQCRNFPIEFMGKSLKLHSIDGIKITQNILNIASLL